MRDAQSKCTNAASLAALCAADARACRDNGQPMRAIHFQLRATEWAAQARAWRLALIDGRAVTESGDWL